MTRYATILLLAATINAQFAGDAAAGGAATKPKLSKFGETVATQKDKEGADEFTHGREFAEFMKLEVGDMTPRETGANKWAYDPRYNRGLRLPDGIYNTKPRRTRPPAMAPRGLAAKKAASANTPAAAVVSEAPLAPATPPMDAVGRAED